MAGQNGTSTELEAFARHLEGYGGREERWPEAARRRFGPLLGADEEARRLLAEARALDRLLDQASVPVPERVIALVDRIAAAAAALPRDEMRPSVACIVDLAEVRAARGPGRPLLRAPGVRVAAALAASLLIGLYLGTSPTVISAVDAAAGVVGLAEQGDSADLAMFDDGADSGGEDLL